MKKLQKLQRPMTLLVDIKFKWYSKYTLALNVLFILNEFLVNINLTLNRDIKRILTIHIETCIFLFIIGTKNFLILEVGGNIL